MTKPHSFIMSDSVVLPEHELPNWIVVTPELLAACRVAAPIFAEMDDATLTAALREFLARAASELSQRPFKPRRSWC